MEILQSLLFEAYLFDMIFQEMVYYYFQMICSCYCCCDCCCYCCCCCNSKISSWQMNLEFRRSQVTCVTQVTYQEVTWN